ncbi:MAG: hypothetical protein WAO61_00995 [Solirubrobacterales bacterium]
MEQHLPNAVGRATSPPRSRARREDRIAAERRRVGRPGQSLSAGEMREAVRAAMQAARRVRHDSPGF